MPQSILVIDDDPAVRETLRLILESAGYGVYCAENGALGLEAFARRRPDLVITDIIMPEMEGIQAIRSLREISPDLPILVISGGSRWGAVDYLELAKRLGATATLTKPFDPEDLLKLVASGLSGDFGASGVPQAY